MTVLYCQLLFERVNNRVGDLNPELLAGGGGTLAILS